MPHRLSEVDRRARQFQFALPEPPVLVIKTELKPRGTPTPQTETVMKAAAEKYALTANQLRIIMDIYGFENYMKVVQAVSGMITDQHMEFEDALNRIEFLS